MVKSREYYIEKAQKRWKEVFAAEIKKLKEDGYIQSEEDEDLWVHPETKNEVYPSDNASITYDKVLNIEEMVGYYLWLHDDNALKDWISNTESIEMSEQDKEVDRILKELCA